MISPQLSHALRLAGLRWRPVSGDLFVISREGFEGDVFAVSDMTIEAHEYETGTVLGFNGTTEWALDSVSTEDSLWLPREDQLRGLLGPTFHALTRGEAGDYEVSTTIGGEIQLFTAPDAEDAYGSALLAYIDASLRLEQRVD